MLGRGLESLIPNKGKTQEPPSPLTAGKTVSAKTLPHKDGDAVFQLEVEKITTNPYQPRTTFDPAALQELATSIREFGIIQPLVVSKIEKETERGTEVEYELIAGERRLQAAKLLRMERVPAIIKSAPADRQKLEMAIIENVQRQDLNVMEAARAYAKLQDTFGLTQREIAVKIGKSRETVANILRLLNLPTHIQEALAGNTISESQARLLLAVTDIARQNELFQDITANNISVRDLKKKIASFGRKPRLKISLASASEQLTVTPNVPSSLPPLIDSELAAMIDNMEEALGIKVELEKDSATGNIKLTFHSPEDLQKVIDRLSGGE